MSNNQGDINEVRSQKRCDPATTPVASGQTPRRRQTQGNADQERERAPRESEVNPPLTPPWRGSRGFEQLSKNIAP